MINMHISWWLEHNQKFSNTIWISVKQGLHRQPSNTDRNNKAFEESNTLSAPFLDITSAYDDIHCSTLMDRLKAVGFSGNLLASIFNLVASREL
jgi:hypothetical protein